MEYMVIYKTHPFSMIGGALEKLSKEVNEAIQKGWTPLGGICYDSKGILFQAMIKQ